MMQRPLAACLLGLALFSNVWSQSFPFVIPGDDASPTAVDRSSLLNASLLAEGGPGSFVQARDGHFYVGERRVRFWGMNLCFGANFPTHDEADLVAPHLAKLGVNAVRFHHMDMLDAPGGIWKRGVNKGVRVFDPLMVDRLDYFLAKLHEHGIYADLNLHVSRTLTRAEGFPTSNDLPWWAASNKWVMYYDRDVQREVKRYCRMLLTHRNPYRRQLRRVDDPGIALVEMLNENYFSVQGYDLYRRMPARFQRSLIGRWNEWLVKKYSDQDAMLNAWNADQPPLGDFLIQPEPWADKLESQNGSSRWIVGKTDAGLPMRFVQGNPDLGNSENGADHGAVHGAVRFEPSVKTENDYSQQLLFPNLTTEKDFPLTLSFWVRSDSPRKFKVELSSSAGGNWRSFGLFEQIEIGSRWQRIERVIFPPESLKSQVNLGLSFGDDRTPIEFCNIQLRQGAATKQLPMHQSLADGTIGIPEAGWPIGSHQDMKRFMVDVEREWISELKTYLRDTLGVKVPITGSQINYHDPSVNEDFQDFLDLHNYWHHPLFPTDAQWSPERWTVGNDPMEAAPTRSSWPANSLLKRMGWRHAAKPMTLSEWNYPEPSLYSSGCVPMAAVLCALQDWDAVFFFQYDQQSAGKSVASSPWFRDRANDFFSFNGQPVKLALFSQFANVFLRGDLAPLHRVKSASVAEPLDGRWGLSHRLEVFPSKRSTGPEPFPDKQTRLLSTPDRTLRWISDPPKTGHLELNTRATQGVWGTIANQRLSTSALKLSVGDIQPNYGTVLVSSTDGEPIESAEHSILIVAGHSQNQNMGWNADRTSVGKRWGDGPTQVTTFPVKIQLTRTTPIRCFALDGSGARVREIPVQANENGVEFAVAPRDRTLWYELESVR